MKVNAEYVAVMRDAIAPLDTAERRAAYMHGDFPRADRCCDLELRYRWDLAYDAQLTGFICDLYNEDRSMNDTHIDTVLRTIIPPLAV